jgi:hypothetical protein
LVAMPVSSNRPYGTIRYGTVLYRIVSYGTTILSSRTQTCDLGNFSYAT